VVVLQISCSLETVLGMGAIVVLIEGWSFIRGQVIECLS